MKYSLTRLLLEDTAAQQVNFDVLPSAEDAEGVAIINTYAWFTKSLKKIKELAGGGMTLLYRYGDSDVRAIIDGARDIARKKDEEMQALIADSALCDFIWSKFDPSGSTSPDDKQEMAKCLGYFADSMGNLKTEPAPGQSVDAFEAEIMQGCEEIKTAAAISIIDDLRKIIAEDNGELAAAVKKSTLSKIRAELGEGGESFSIDLEDDPEIRKIFDAQEEAERDFRKVITRTGKSFIFQYYKTLSFNVSQTPGSYASLCSKRRVYEIRRPISLAAVLLEMRHPLDELSDDAVEAGDVEEDEEEEGAAPDEQEQPALQPDPTSLQEALNQLVQRYGRARKIVDTLRMHDDLSMDDVLLAVKPNPMRALRFRFPKEDGSLGGPAQIATQGSISPERAGAGIIISFLMGARSKRVQPSVLRMIAALVDDRVSFDETGKIKIKPDAVRVLSSLSDEATGLEKSKDLRLALIYAICAVDEYAASKSPDELGMLRDVSLSQYGDSWKENLISFYYMMQQDPEWAKKTKIRIRPGAKNDAWIKKIIKSIRHPGSARDKIDFLRSELGEIPITTMRPYPSIERDDTAISMPQLKGAKKSGDRAKRAAEATKFLIRGVSGLTKRVMQSRAELGRPNRTPGSSGGGNLNVMSMCNAFAMYINRSRRSGAGKLLMDMGYTSSNALLLRADPATGQDVWDALVELTGAKSSNAPFNILNYSRWLDAMTGDDAARALSAFRVLVLRETANTVARAVLHAVTTMTERGVLPTGKASLAQQLTRELSVQYAKIVADVESQQVLVAGSEMIYTATAGTSGMRPTQVQVHRVEANQLAIPSELEEISRELTGDNFYVVGISASDDAPREVNIESIALVPDAPAGSGTGEGASDAPPEAGPAPTSAPPPAPPPPADPEPEPEPDAAGANRRFTIESNIVPAKAFDQSEVSITVTVSHDGKEFDIEMTGIIKGGTRQTASALSDPASVTVTDGALTGSPTPSSHHAAARLAVDSLAGGDFTLGDVCKAIEEALVFRRVTVQEISVSVVES